MATSFTGSLGQTNNYSSINELITQWPTAAQNKGIELSGITFDGGVTNYTNPSVISNLTFATNQNPQSWLSYGSSAGIGVPSSYDGWFTDVNKIRAEINHNPNTNQSQVLKVKWADNQDITSATIGLSALLPIASPGVGDKGNEVGLLQIYKEGAPVSASNFTITRLNAPSAPKPIVVSSDGVTFIGDRTDGNFTFQIVGDSLTGVTFDELRFSAKAYDSPTSTSFKSDSSDYLVRNIQYQGISNVAPTLPSLFQFQQANYTVPEGGVATINVIRTGGTGAASINYATVDGTASSAGTAADYTTAVGALNFAAGQTTASFTVTALSDLILESPETVSLVLSGGNVGSNPSFLTILDVPPTGTTPTPTPTPTSPSLFQFAQPNYTVPEGGVATINVTRTGGTAAASINYATLDGSASSAGTAADYTGAAGTLNFAAGQTTANFTVTALNDLILESPETVNLVLLGGNVGSNPSLLTINDVPPGTTPTPTPTPTGTTPTSVGNTYFFGAANYSVTEGSAAAITINRSGNLSVPSVIVFTTGDGSAQSTGSSPDYSSVAQAVNFAAGQSSVQVPVPTLFDTLTEFNNETVNLFLSGGSVASPSVAVLSIIDASAAAPTSFYYGPSSGSAPNGGTGTFTINRTGNTSVSASVDYLIVPPGFGQPSNYVDYSINPFPTTPNGGTLTFNPGVTSVSLTISNFPGFTNGPVNLGFGPGTNIGTPPNSQITLI